MSLSNTEAYSNVRGSMNAWNIEQKWEMKADFIQLYYISAQLLL